MAKPSAESLKAEIDRLRWWLEEIQHQDKDRSTAMKTGKGFWIEAWPLAERALGGEAASFGEGGHDAK